METVKLHDVVRVGIARIHEAPWNANVVNEATMAKIKRSLRRYGSVENSVVRPSWCVGARSANEVETRRAALMDDEHGYETLSGNHRLRIYREEGVSQVPCVVVELADPEAKILAQVLNRTRGASDDPIKLRELLKDAVKDIPTEDVTGLLPHSEKELAALLKDDGAGAPGDPNYKPVSMTDQFIVPPFSVLDARQGYWKSRKRAWLSLGIRSEVGREGLGATANKSEGKYDYMSGFGGGDAGSIFDPVLCELAYRWFSPPGSRVLDPFAGGSVRGVVAALVGRRYVGIDLRDEQVAADQQQWVDIERRLDGGLEPDCTVDQTPVHYLPGRDIWLKRDDLFCVGGVQGGKVRTCWALAQGAKGLVTAGSRQSPQVNIVAHVAKKLGIPCRAHVPSGELSPEVLAARDAGAEVVQHKPGYNSVIIARAREDAEARGWTEIPFGMECAEAPRQTATQVAGLPDGIKRLVVPVGSGMSLAGILQGIQASGRTLPVLGVIVGADPTKRLDQYAPAGWKDMVELVKSPLDYHAEAEDCFIDDVRLDPIYEAKCIPYLQPGDCFWVVGIRQTAMRPALGAEGVGSIIPPVWKAGDSRNIPTLVGKERFDFVFSCPPYADLEVYSDDPRDLSTLEYEQFVVAYRQIIQQAVDRLKKDRFACFVVGDIRDGSGAYRNFVAHTIQAFEDAGARLYNEAVLVTSVGSLPLRAGRAFKASRKLGKAHQNFLVFVKGDPQKAAEACGTIEVHMPGSESSDG